VRPDIIRRRTEQTVVLQLLDHMPRPPGDACEHEHRCEQIEFEPLNTEGRFAAVVKAAGRAVVLAGTTPLEEVIR